MKTIQRASDRAEEGESAETTLPERDHDTDSVIFLCVLKLSSFHFLKIQFQAQTGNNDLSGIESPNNCFIQSIFSPTFIPTNSSFHF